MVTLSIDVGIKNYAVLVALEDEIVSVDNLDLSPYKCSKLVDALDLLIGDRKVQTVLVERQIRNSFDVSEVAHHTQAYFCIRHPDAVYKIIDPKKKDLSGVKGYSARKKMAIEKTLAYLGKVGRNDVKEKICGMKKKDDVCDAICQWLTDLKLSDKDPLFKDPSFI